MTASLHRLASLPVASVHSGRLSPSVPGARRVGRPKLQLRQSRKGPIFTVVRAGRSIPQFVISATLVQRAACVGGPAGAAARRWRLTDARGSSGSCQRVRTGARRRSSCRIRRVCLVPGINQGGHRTGLHRRCEFATTAGGWRGRGPPGGQRWWNAASLGDRRRRSTCFAGRWAVLRAVVVDGSPRPPSSSGGGIACPTAGAEGIPGRQRPRTACGDPVGLAGATALGRR